MAAVQYPHYATHPFRHEDAWAAHTSLSDRRRAPAHLPPCNDKERREQQSSLASPYPRSSCSLPRINDLFASHQLITPTSASDHKVETTVNFQPSSLSVLPMTPTARPSLIRTQSDYRPSQPQRSPSSYPYRSTHRHQSPRSPRASERRQCISTTRQPHRKADIANLLNDTDDDDRQSWPSNESGTALRSATVSPSYNDPRSHQPPRCDSPFEDMNARRRPIPMPTQEFAPATYVYQSTAYEGVQNIPGLGPHHVYAGGYCVPTHVLGEAVNPYWGLTKGKVPRKRLSVACSTCRKKKIRCEPSLGGCLQCKKAQRPCCVEAVKRRRTRVSASSDVDMSDEKDATMNMASDA